MNLRGFENLTVEKKRRASGQGPPLVDNGAVQSIQKARGNF